MILIYCLVAVLAVWQTSTWRLMMNFALELWGAYPSTRFRKGHSSRKCKVLRNAKRWTDASYSHKMKRNVVKGCYVGRFVFFNTLGARVTHPRFGQLYYTTSPIGTTIADVVVNVSQLKEGYSSIESVEWKNVRSQRYMAMHALVRQPTQSAPFNDGIWKFSSTEPAVDTWIFSSSISQDMSKPFQEVADLHVLTSQQRDAWPALPLTKITLLFLFFIWN